MRDAVPVDDTVHERLASAERDMLRDADGDREGVEETSGETDGEPVTDRVMLPGGERDDEIEGDSDGEALDDGERDGERDGPPEREPDGDIVTDLELSKAEPERIEEIEGALETVIAETLGCAAEAETDGVDEPDTKADCENDGESEGDRVNVADTLGDREMGGDPDDEIEIVDVRVTIERVGAEEAPAVFEPDTFAEFEFRADVLGDEESEGDANDEGEIPRVVDGDSVIDRDTVRLSDGDPESDGDRVSEEDGVIDARGAGDFVVENMAVTDREASGETLELGDREDDPELDGVLDGFGESDGRGDAEEHPLDEREMSGERVPFTLLTEPAGEIEKRDALDDTVSVRTAVTDEDRVTAAENERDVLGEFVRDGSVENEMLGQPETEAVFRGDLEPDIVPDGDGDCETDAVDDRLALSEGLGVLDEDVELDDKTDDDVVARGDAVLLGETDCVADARDERDSLGEPDILIDRRAEKLEEFDGRTDCVARVETVDAKLFVELTDRDGKPVRLVDAVNEGERDDDADGAELRDPLGDLDTSGDAELE